VYFLTDSPPSNFFAFLDGIVEDAGYRTNPKWLSIPRGIMYVLGWLTEGFAFLMRPFVELHPKLSRFAVSYTCNDFTISSDRAAKDFGYSPLYSVWEARRRTASFFRQHGPVNAPKIPYDG
jgi:hypothetical protein